MVTALKAVVELHAIESSNLAAIGYDPASQTAAVRFKNSATTHHYGEFSLAKWEKWQAAESKGSFFAKEVRNEHPHSIVESDEA
jgi:hypothetical protein